MVFSEIYGAYYNAVAAIIRDTINNKSSKSIYEIVKEHAFGESFITIEKCLNEEFWPLLKDGKSIIKNEPKMPLTILQKRWLKAISLDSRIKLFGDVDFSFLDVEPLFTKDDIKYFDKYNDGDDYTSEEYISHFKIILDAIKNKTPLKFNIINGKGSKNYLTALPINIEYSEKDDKFRVTTTGCRYGRFINIGRIISCKPCNIKIKEGGPIKDEHKKVVLEVIDEKRSVERLLLHFAHFSKEAEKIDDIHYRVSIDYEKSDETEMVIRLLSFGPFVRVLEPSSVKNEIKQRLIMQKNCGLF